MNDKIEAAGQTTGKVIDADVLIIVLGFEITNKAILYI
jgi:hypothetical protein